MEGFVVALLLLSAPLLIVVWRRHEAREAALKQGPGCAGCDGCGATRGSSCPSNGHARLR